MDDEQKKSDKKELKTADRAMIKRIVRLFAPHKSLVVVTALTVLVAVLIGLAPPFFVQLLRSLMRGLQKRIWALLGVIQF